MVEFVVPRLHRIQVTETPDALTVTVPSKRSAPTILFAVVYLAVGVALARQTWKIVAPPFAGISGVGDLILYGFLAAFALFALNGLYSLLFELWGVEIIVSQGGRLRLQRTVLGLGHRASYLWEAVNNLRVLDLSRGPFIRGWGIGKSRNGPVAFDHQDQRIRFGDDLEVDEAVKVVQLLMDHSTISSRAPLGAV